MKESLKCIKCRFFNSIRRFVYPSQRIDRLKGRTLFESVFLHKKAFLVCLAVYFITHAATLLTSTGAAVCDIDYELNVAEKVKKASNISFEETFLVDNSAFFAFAPFNALDALAAEHRLWIPAGSLHAFCGCLALLFLVYAVKFCKALRTQFFHLDSASVFKEVFTGWNMSNVDQAAANKKTRKGYLNVKAKLRHGFKKWSVFGIFFVIFTNLLLIIFGVICIYFAWFFNVDNDDGGIHRRVMRLLDGNATLYYVFSLGAYFAVKHALPTALYLIRNIGYQNPEVKVNFYAARVFSLISCFYFALIVSLYREFPVFWKDVLKWHLYLHISLDVVLLPLKLIFVFCPNRISAKIAAFSPRIHPFDEFVAHETPCNFAINLFVFLVSIPLSGTLTALVLVKLLAAYSVVNVAAHCIKNTHHDFYYARNIDFLESSFALIQLSQTLFLQIYFLLPQFKNCNDLSSSSSLPNSADELFASLLESKSAACLAVVVLLLSLILLRAHIRGYCLNMESRYLRRHLDDINQDKNYQVMKQKQWYPFCKCHESKAKRSTSGKTSKSSTSSLLSNSSKMRASKIANK